MLRPPQLTGKTCKGRESERCCNHVTAWGRCFFFKIPQKYYTLNLKAKTKDDGKISACQGHTTRSLYLKAASAESRTLNRTGAAVYQPWSARVEWIRRSRVVEAADGGTFVPAVLRDDCVSLPRAEREWKHLECVAETRASSSFHLFCTRHASRCAACSPVHQSIAVTTGLQILPAKTLLVRVQEQLQQLNKYFSRVTPC